MNVHKHFVKFGLPIVLLAVLLSLAFVSSHSGAVDAPDLINAAQLDVQKSADVTVLPTSLNGNVDCIQDGPYDCVVDTTFGKFSSGFVKRNRTSSYYQLISFVDNKAHSIAIPNSNTIINYTTEPPYGFYLYFTKNFASSITDVTIPGTNIHEYHINHTFDAKLADKANHRLAADYASMSFSANGQWMVVSMPNVAMLRVNLETFEVVPFAIGFNYTIGLAPSVKTAISNDGRYAVVASGTFSRFEVYDLTTCGAVPSTINGPVACQSRNLKTVMQQKVPGYLGLSQARFISDNNLRIYGGYNVGTGNKIAPFTINPAGTGTHQHDFLALGDSYISGEGAYNYLQGTDTSDNKCHVSLLSYPYLLAHDLNYNSFHSVACSGAKTDDVINASDDYKGQAEPKTKKHDRPNDQIKSFINNFSPGYIDQLDFVTTYQPQVITLSVGGNDVGFSSILASCVSPLNLSTCYSTYEDRLELVRQINAQFPNLVSTYQTLKNNSPSDTRIYVVGYPQIVKPGGNCGFNVQLNADEVVFAQQFTSYLDSVVQQAAAKAGVYYVDTQNAFNGHRLCEAGPGKSAVNGLTRGSDFPKLLGGFIHGPFSNESYHPTPLGYGLLRGTVLAVTNSLGTTMPAPNLLATAPTEFGLDILNSPHSGRTVSTTNFDDNLSGDILPRGTASDIFVSGLDNSLKPVASYRAELHSNPVILGNFTSSSVGDLSFQITIPSNTPTGFHSLHIYGTNVAGEPVDIYKTVYVAANGDDYNGDLIPNNSDPCVFVDASGQDFDQDGIDDACDGNIINPPPPVPVPATPGNTDNSPTQTLQPSVGLPPSSGNTPVLVVSPAPVQSQTPATQTTSSPPAISQAIKPENLSGAGGQDFFASYYSLPNPINNIHTVVPTKAGKVLAAQTSIRDGKSNGPAKIMFLTMGGLIVTFGIIFCRKIGL